MIDLDKANDLDNIILYYIYTKTKIKKSKLHITSSSKRKANPNYRNTWGQRAHIVPSFQVPKCLLDY